MRPQTLFDVVLHLGTLVPVLFVYRREIGRMVDSWPPRGGPLTRHSGPMRLAMLVVVGSVPTGLSVGLGDLMESLALDLAWIAAALTLNAGILFALGVVQGRMGTLAEAWRSYPEGRPLCRDRPGRRGFQRHLSKRLHHHRRLALGPRS